jgi:lauroyl/myristoyl acyltransferase
MRAFFLKLAFYLFAALPLPVAHALGAVLGWLFLVIPTSAGAPLKSILNCVFPK